MEGVFTVEEFQKASIQHFHDIQNRPENIMDLPIDEQAKWADPITKKYATNIKYVTHRLNEPSQLYLDVSDVCGAAYMALNSEYTSRFKQIHKNLLREYKYQQQPWCIIF